MDLPGIHDNVSPATKVPECLDPKSQNCVVPTVSPNAQPLTDKQYEEAAKDLIDDSFLRLNYKRYVKSRIDPRLADQNFYCFSFIPSKGAKPDNDGVFGVMKVRGVFKTPEEADEWARYLIANFDTYNRIMIGQVGCNFPVTNSISFSKQIENLKGDKGQLTEPVGDNSAFAEKDGRKVAEKCRKVEQEFNDEKKNEDDDMLKEREEAEKKASDEAKNPLPDDHLTRYIECRLDRGKILTEIQAWEKEKEKRMTILRRLEENIKRLDSIHPDYLEKGIAQYREMGEKYKYDVEPIVSKYFIKEQEEEKKE